MGKIYDPHPEYVRMLPRWVRCRDAAEGQDAVKAASPDGTKAPGQRYLPILPGMTLPEYQVYLSRAFWFNATGRTIEGLGGLIFRKDPVVEGLPLTDDLVEDVDLAGTSLVEFARVLTDEVLTVGRVGVMIDVPVAGEGLTVAQAEALGVRPFAALYRAEDVINWTEGRVNNRSELTRLVLREPDPEIDGFQYRELILTDAGYLVRLHRRPKDSEEYTPGPPSVPLMGGEPLDRLPFWFFNAKDLKARPKKPPLQDLVDLNVSHYHTMAELESGRLWCGHPTVVLCGDFGAGDATEGAAGQKSKPKIKLGGMSALVGDQGSSASYLYLPSDGLTPLEKADEQKRLMMARVGSRVLQDDPQNGVEAYQTALIRANGETSVLAGIAHIVGRGLSELMTLAAEWRGPRAQVAVTLNSEFFPEPFDAATLTALVAAWIQGGLSDEALFGRYKAMGILTDQTTLEAFKGGLQKPTPQLSKDLKTSPSTVKQ
jgi:hypothetical protein